MDWIGTIVESIRGMDCPCCGSRLASCGVRGIRAEPDVLVVRLACSLCGEHSVAVVKREPLAHADPITRDEVLDAHEFLKSWVGPVGDLMPIGSS